MTFLFLGILLMIISLVLIDKIKLNKHVCFPQNIRDVKIDKTAYIIILTMSVVLIIIGIFSFMLF